MKSTDINQKEKIYPAVDLHCDTLLGLLELEEQGKPASFAKNDLSVDAYKLHQGQYVIQTLALFTDRGGPRQPEHQVMRLYLQYLRALEQNPDLVPVRTKLDLQKLLQTRRSEEPVMPVGILLSLEEGDVMFGDLELLELWQKLGVRMIALTWNYPNRIGHPNFTVSDDWDYRQGSPLLITENEKGLTEYGKAYVKKMEELGILVDVSHLGDKGFWDVMETARKPVIASHSNARAVCSVSRNLSDEMIKALAKTGGVMGMNFCADFLSDRGDNHTSIEDIIRHIRHITDLVGTKHVALGTDFDGIHSTLDIPDASFMPHLWEALEKEGYTQEEITDMAGGNMLRILEQTLPD